MISRKHYLIQLERNGDRYWLRNNNRGFFWNNHGKDKEYKSLTAATKRAYALSRVCCHEKINVVEVTFRPCTPELPDGFYEPVQKIIASF